VKSGFVVALLLVAAVSGCFTKGSDQGGNGGVDAPVPQRYEMPADPMPEGAGHDHGDPTQHRFLWNYDFSSRDPLLQNAANVAGVHALDVQAGYLFGAVYGSHTAALDGGLVVWDVHTDPSHPKQVGRWTIPGSVGGDRSMEATPDGDFAVISTEPVDCAGHVNPGGAPASAYLIDTSDKAHPLVSDALTVAGRTLGDVLSGGGGLAGPSISQHSVAVHRIHGEDYAFIAGKIYHIARTEQGGRLVHVANIGTGHDIYVRDTPWNTTWALSANGGGGLIVWDVTDPAAAFQVATWDLQDRKELAAAGKDYYFHTSDVSFQPDGQVLIVLSSEDFADHVSPLWILDGNPLRGLTAKPSDPYVLDMLGTWSNPGHHNALTGLTFSLHNPRFADGGILTIASYHAGMWQLDVRAPEFWADPAPIAYAAFADGTPTVTNDPVESVVQERLCGLTISLDTPSYWDVEVGANGVTYLADGFMGLYTFTPTASHPVYGANRTVEFTGTSGT
jgi:hypothetical protein